MDFRFYIINERNGERIEIPEPIGFDNFKPTLRRDATSHGLNFEFAEQQLSFNGYGYNIIVSEYETLGINSKIRLLIEYSCDGLWQEFYTGMLDFATLEIENSDACFAKLNVGQHGVQMTFKNRWDTKVDVESLATFGGVTMPRYNNIGKEIQIPAKTVRIRSYAELSDDVIIAMGSVRYADTWFRYYKLPFGKTISSECPKFNNPPTFEECSPIDANPRNCAIFENIDDDFTGTVFKLKTKYRIRFQILQDYYDVGMTAYVSIRNYTADGKFYKTIRELPIASGQTYELSEYINENEIIEQGGFISAFLFVRSNATGGSPAFVDIKYALEAHSRTYFDISEDNKFSTTSAKTFMIHETLSRIAESITDGQLTVKSDYYGRQDSNINPTPQSDGAAGLRCFTNGLMLRRAEYSMEGNDASTLKLLYPKLTVSFKELFEGLNAIDAIGFGIEDNFLRVEPIGHFYNDGEPVLRLENVAEITRKLNFDICFGLANIGYAKWEAEEWNGIDGFHGKRQYRTRLNTDKKFEQFSKLVADSYAIEATRRRQVTDPSKDWRYDNDIFIFDLRREGTNAFGVNQGNHGDNVPNTLIDPSTIFNVELSPARNAARWFSWIMQGVTPDVGQELIYTGTEGYSGAITKSTPEKRAAAIITENVAENQNIVPVNIAAAELQKPKFKPMIAEFEYPLTIEQFNTIKGNPYGLIEFNGEYGWIKSLEADIVNGMAKFTLILKNT